MPIHYPKHPQFRNLSEILYNYVVVLIYLSGLRDEAGSGPSCYSFDNVLGKFYNWLFCFLARYRIFQL